MHELRIDVEQSTTAIDSVTVIVRGTDENNHSVCLYIDEVGKPVWYERLMGITWSDKLAKSHGRAEKIIRDHEMSQPELDRILFPYRITKRK